MLREQHHKDLPNHHISFKENVTSLISKLLAVYHQNYSNCVSVGLISLYILKLRGLHIQITKGFYYVHIFCIDSIPVIEMIFTYKKLVDPPPLPYTVRNINISKIYCACDGIWKHRIIRE